MTDLKFFKGLTKGKKPSKGKLDFDDDKVKAFKKSFTTRLKKVKPKKKDK